MEKSQNLMKKQQNLQKMFEQILGSRNVYYQPPSTTQMNYPAIVYSRSNIQNTFADDSVYTQSYAYEVTVIDRDPNSEIVEKVSALPMCKFDRHFIISNLNHDVFTLHY